MFSLCFNLLSRGSASEIYNNHKFTFAIFFIEIVAKMKIKLLKFVLLLTLINFYSGKGLESENVLRKCKTFETNLQCNKLFLIDIPKIYQKFSAM
jgi:hypothetical protein